jgi:hypothetical protein
MVGIISFVNGIAESVAPSYRESFLAPQIKNDYIPGLVSEKDL